MILNLKPGLIQNLSVLDPLKQMDLLEFATDWFGSGKYDAIYDRIIYPIILKNL